METNKETIEDVTGNNGTMKAPGLNGSVTGVGIMLALAIDATERIEYATAETYTLMGDYAVPTCDITCGTSYSPAITGKDVRNAVMAVIGGLKPEERPSPLSQSGLCYDMLRALTGASAVVQADKCRVVKDVTIFRPWTGASDSEQSDDEAITGHPYVKIEEEGMTYDVLRPTGRTVGYAMEKSAFVKAVRLFSPDGSATVRVPTFLGIKRRGKEFAIVAYVAWGDIIEFIARAGIRSVSADPSSGVIVMPTVNASVAKGLPEVYKAARAHVDCVAAELLEGLNEYLGGAPMPKTTEATRSVITGGYFSMLLENAGREELSLGGTAWGRAMGENNSLEK